MIRLKLFLLSLIALTFFFTHSSCKSQKYQQATLPLNKDLIRLSEITAAEVNLDGIKEITDLSFDLSKKIITAKDSCAIPFSFNAVVQLTNPNITETKVDKIVYRLIHNNEIIATDSLIDEFTIAPVMAESRILPITFDAYSLVGKSFDEYGVVRLLFTFPERINSAFTIQVKPVYHINNIDMGKHFETID